MRASHPLLRSARTTVGHQVSRRLTFLLIALCSGTLLFSTAARAQGSISLVTLATDQSPLNLSNRFGVPVSSVVNQGGDFAFVGEGGSALFLRRAGASPAVRLLQFGDDRLKARCDGVARADCQRFQDGKVFWRHAGPP